MPAMLMPGIIGISTANAMTDVLPRRGRRKPVPRLSGFE
jgi:hypothetical protein